MTQTVIAGVGTDPDTGGSTRSATGPVLSGVATAAIGCAGLGLGAAGIFDGVAPIHIDWVLPLAGLSLDIQPLGGFFMALTGAVAIIVGGYWIGYARVAQLGRTPLITLPLFVATLLLVPAAGSTTTFLLGWELMAISSLVLLLTEHRRVAVRESGVVYAVMTQLGFIAILTALAILGAAAGTDQFAEMGAVPDGVVTAVFLLSFIGFGSKAGLLPLHAWLPRAHPEAPSAVSALMSAAMVNLGIYGILRINLQLLGPGPRWWGVLLLVVGGVSAIYGVLQASVAGDLKRLLAYSTTENMGLITLGLGVATLLSASGARLPAVVAATAAMLHLIAHAAFKSLGFLAAGSVLVATGLRDLDRLGGLARRMPATTTLFGVAALGAAGLPLGAGFVSEWLLVQSLIHTGVGEDATPDALVALAMPLTVGAVALTIGLGVAAMVKAFGIGFLARPHSQAATDATESPPVMAVAMAAAAAGCVILAVAPGTVGGVLRRVVDTLPATAGDPAVDFGPLVQLPGLDGSIGPGLLAVAVALAVAAVAALANRRSRRRPAAASLPLWSCGLDGLSPRMQYTATSFAQPLQQVFDDVLQPDTDVAVTRLGDSEYLIDRISYRAADSDVIEQRLHRPVLRMLGGCARFVRAAHTGSVHLYLAYGALGVLLILVVSR